MAYPSREEFALASLGYLWLYKMADMTEGINARLISADNVDSCGKSIDSIGFSMSFDFDYIGVLEILDKLKIPFYKKERDENFPLIFAGGPVITTNPTPYEAFFDFMILGDGEGVFKEILEILKDTKDKTEALNKLKNVEGVYVSGEVKKATAALSEVIYTPILSEKSYFKNTFIIELARGCMNCCAFVLLHISICPIGTANTQK